MADFNATDLRGLADMLDALTDATERTGAIVQGWSGEHLTFNNHVIRLDWQQPSDDRAGRYVLDWPDGT